MKTISLSTTLILVLSLSILEAQPILQWESRINGPLAADKGKCIALDKSGNIYVGGSSDAPGQGSNYIIVKYSSDGQILWSRSYDGSAHSTDEITAIEVDQFSNVYVTGKSKETGQGYDIVSIKYNSEGIQQWIEDFNGLANADDIGLDIAVDTTTGISYVVGSSYYSIGSSITSAAIIKYDSLGNEVWRQGYHVGISSLGNYTANHVLLNNYGNIVMSVYDDAYDEFQVFEILPTTGFYYDVYSSDIPGYPRAITVDDNGNIYTTSSYVNSVSNYYTAKFLHFTTYPEWEKAYAGTANGIDVSTDIKVDANQNVYVTGYVDYYTNTPINNNIVTIKYDPAGQLLWFRYFDGPANKNDSPVSLLINNNSNPDIYVIGNSETTISGIYDIVILKYDYNGNPAWQKTYDCGNSGNDKAFEATRNNFDNIYITGISNCNGTNDDIKTLKYCSSIPAQPGTITGFFEVCSGNLITYSITPVPGATSYTWTLPSGWSIPSSESEIQTIAGSSGIISVVANNSSCSSQASSQSVIVNSTPQKPEFINGLTSVCEGSNQEYSITPVPGAINYTWILPANWIGSSIETNINVNVGVTGIISVIANGINCSSDTTTINVTVSPLPGELFSIMGSSTVCSNTSNQYIVPVCANATNYIWQVPTDWSANSNQNNASITTNNSSGTITVTASNSCGSSNSQSIPITVAQTPVAPGIISGNLTVCSGTVQSYSVPMVAGITGYTWNLPSGWGTPSFNNSINISVGSSGTISVTANNGMCSSSPQTLAVTVNNLPDIPGTISGDGSICLGTSNSYSIAPIPGATSYIWSWPGGSPDTTTEFSIPIIAVSSGTISVRARNECGVSDLRTFQVTIKHKPTQPQPINGETTVCQGSSNLYFTNLEQGASYEWNLPQGWIGNSSNNLLSTIAGGQSGNIFVIVKNECGSDTNSIAVIVNPLDTSVTQNGVNLLANANPSLASYQWVTCPGYAPVAGATSQLFTAPWWGYFAVIVTQGPCSDTSNCHFVNIIDKVNETISSLSISLYPNPTNGELFLSCDGMRINSVEVYNLTGILVLTQKENNSSESTLNLQTLPQGVYFIEIASDTSRITRKIIKI